jgi:hypothetical protein
MAQRNYSFARHGGGISLINIGCLAMLVPAEADCYVLEGYLAAKSLSDLPSLLSARQSASLRFLPTDPLLPVCWLCRLR